MQRFVEWHRLYLTLAYFCTVYRLTVTFEQLSKYSNIYRAGRAGREGTRARGRGRAPAGPRACAQRTGCSCGGAQMGCSCDSPGAEVQLWMYRQSRARGSSPAGETRATAGLTGSATLVSASTAFWKSGCFSCTAGVRSSAGEMRKMEGEQSKAPGRVSGCWVSQEGLQALCPGTEQQDQRWQGGRMNVRRHEHMTMGKCQIKPWGIAWKSVQGKAAGEARSISDSVLTEESGLSHRTMQSPAFCIFFFWVTQNVDSFA